MSGINTSRGTYILPDQSGVEHSLNIQEQGRLLIDGAVGTITAIAEQITLATTASMLTIHPATFWETIAGTVAPQPDEVGRLLAYSIASNARIAALEQLLTAHPLGEVPLPSKQLDPMSRSVLAAYDGTGATTCVLARILGREPEQITRLAKEYGFAIPQQDAPQPPDDDQKEGAETGEEPRASSTQPPITADLIKAYLLEERAQPTLKEAIKVIASRLHESPGRIQGIVYGKGLNAYWKELHPSSTPGSTPKETAEQQQAATTKPRQSAAEEHKAGATAAQSTANDIFFLEQISIDEVSALLETVHCHLEQTLTPAGTGTQYFFEGPYGISLAFVAQSDGARTVKDTAAPKHTARAWLWGTMHAESVRVQQHLLDVLQQTYPKTVVYPDVALQTPEQQRGCLPTDEQQAA